MDVEKEVNGAMTSSFDHLKEEIKGLRTNRANPAFLDHVQVDAYGTIVKLKEIANITCPESRQLLVTPYDSSTINSVAKAIDQANLNVRAIVEGGHIRINMPAMDSEMRKKMIAKCKEMAEKAKVSIREIRRKYNEVVKKQKSDGDITEDVTRKLEKKIQESTDKFCKEIDSFCLNKEKEILEI